MSQNPNLVDYELVISFPKINSNYELQYWVMWNGSNDNRGFTVHNDKDHACARFRIKDILRSNGLTNDAMHTVFIRCIALTKHITDTVLKHLMIQAINKWFFVYSEFITNYSKGLVTQENIRSVEYDFKYVEYQGCYPVISFSAKCIDRN